MTKKGCLRARGALVECFAFPRAPRTFSLREKSAEIASHQRGCMGSEGRVCRRDEPRRGGPSQAIPCRVAAVRLAEDRNGNSSGGALEASLKSRVKKANGSRRSPGRLQSSGRNGLELSLPLRPCRASCRKAGVPRPPGRKGCATPRLQSRGGVCVAAMLSGCPFSPLAGRRWPKADTKSAVADFGQRMRGRPHQQS